MSQKSSQIGTPKFKAHLKSDLCSYIKKTDFKIMTGPDIAGPITSSPYYCGSPEELSLAATFKNDSPPKEIYSITEESPYIEVPANSDTLECSFGPQDSAMLRAEHLFEMGNISHLSSKKEYNDKDYTIDTSARRDLKNSQTQYTQDNTVKTLATEVNQTVDRYNKDSFIDIPNHQNLPEPAKPKLSPIVNNWRPLMFSICILSAVVFSGVVSEHSTESLSFRFLAYSIISLAAVAFSFAIMRKTIFMKKFPKILSLWTKNRVDVGFYIFPQSYKVCQITSIVLGLGISAISLKGDTNNVAKVIIVLLLSITTGCIVQILFALYYVHIFKKALKSARPKSFLGIHGVKKNVYNEFLDDLNDLKAQYSITGKGEHVDTKSRKPKKTIIGVESTNNLKQENNKSSDTLRGSQTSKSELKEKDQVNLKNDKDSEKKYIPSMSLKHVFAGNILLFLWCFGGMFGLVVASLIKNSSISSLTLGLISIPGFSLFYTLVSLTIKRITICLNIRRDLILDLILFVYMLVPYRATIFMLLKQENPAIWNISLFILAKTIWKIGAYAYNFYQLKPKSEDEKTTNHIKKQKTEKGGIVELFKRKHLNFGVKFTFWQHFDIILSTVYIVILPFVRGVNINRFFENGILQAISLIVVLGFDVVIEAILLRAFRYIFIKQGSELKKVNFSAMLYTYIRENLWIFMSSLFLVIYASFNALAIKVSLSCQL